MEMKREPPLGLKVVFVKDYLTAVIITKTSLWLNILKVT